MHEIPHKRNDTTYMGIKRPVLLISLNPEGHQGLDAQEQGQT